MSPLSDISDIDMNNAPDLIIITGMSGAGRTEAMHTFEDLGYFCIDNLPPRLLMNLVSLANVPEQEGPARKLAVVCDARNQDFFLDLLDEIAHLKEEDLSLRVIFLDASDDVLLARYKASRRRHPLCEEGMTVIRGIQKERALLAEVKGLANIVIDTTKKKPQQLKKDLRKQFSNETEQAGLNIAVYSFGFKHGEPRDADIVIDVRFLPNPFYEPSLRNLTGLDDPVRDFVMEREETKEFLECWYNLLTCVMPGYVKEGKQHLSIAIGCTGGQHRSVAISDATGAFLKSLDYRVSVTHRDLLLAETTQEK